MNNLGSISSVNRSALYPGIPQTSKLRIHAKSPAEDALDLRIVITLQEYQGPEQGKWTTIAKNINQPGLDANKCRGRYRTLMCDEKCYRPEVLKRVEEIAQKWLPANEKQFAVEVSSMLSREFYIQISEGLCKKKYLSPATKAKQWSQEEITKLQSFKTKNYRTDWSAIGLQLGKTPAQCKRKYYSLSPETKKRPLENPSMPAAKRLKT